MYADDPSGYFFVDPSEVRRGRGNDRSFRRRRRDYGDDAPDADMRRDVRRRRDSRILRSSRRVKLQAGGLFTTPRQVCDVVTIRDVIAWMNKLDEKLGKKYDTHYWSRWFFMDMIQLSGNWINSPGLEGHNPFILDESNREKKNAMHQEYKEVSIYHSSSEQLQKYIDECMSKVKWNVNCNKIRFFVESKTSITTKFLFHRLIMSLLLRVENDEDTKKLSETVKNAFKETYIHVRADAGPAADDTKGPRAFVARLILNNQGYNPSDLLWSIEQILFASRLEQSFAGETDAPYRLYMEGAPARTVYHIRDIFPGMPESRPRHVVRAGAGAGESDGVSGAGDDEETVSESESGSDGHSEADEDGDGSGDGGNDERQPTRYRLPLRFNRNGRLSARVRNSLLHWLEMHGAYTCKTTVETLDGLLVYKDDENENRRNLMIEQTLVLTCNKAIEETRQTLIAGLFNLLLANDATGFTEFMAHLNQDTFTNKVWRPLVDCLERESINLQCQCEFELFVLKNVASSTKTVRLCSAVIDAVTSATPCLRWHSLVLDDWYRAFPYILINNASETADVTVECRQCDVTERHDITGNTDTWKIINREDAMASVNRFAAQLWLITEAVHLEHEGSRGLLNFGLSTRQLNVLGRSALQKAFFFSGALMRGRKIYVIKLSVKISDTQKFDVFLLGMD